jgi:hypothetical protein
VATSITSHCQLGLTKQISTRKMSYLLPVLLFSRHTYNAISSRLRQGSIFAYSVKHGSSCHRKHALSSACDSVDFAISIFVSMFSSPVSFFHQKGLDCLHGCTPIVSTFLVFFSSIILFFTCSSFSSLSIFFWSFLKRRCSMQSSSYLKDR